MKIRPDHLYAIVLVLIAITSLAFILRGPFSSTAVKARPFKAALIDEVSATDPDAYFLENVTKMLTNAGYPVDYYGPTNVTVSLFQNLPSKGYGIVILRQHSTGLTGDVIALVTSEPYDPMKYVSERQAGLLVEAQIGSENTTYFAFTPTFVREIMQGTFSNTIVIATGCAGLANSEMGQAFLSRGVQVYVSWDQIVLANQSDGGAILFVQAMTSGHTVDYAASYASQNAPSSAVYASQLNYYPLDQSGMVLSTRP